VHRHQVRCRGNVCETNQVEALASYSPQSLYVILSSYIVNACIHLIFSTVYPSTIVVVVSSSTVVVVTCIAP